MKNLMDKVKQFLRENGRFLLFLIGLYLFLTFPLPYYIYTGGGIIPIADRIEVENAYKEKGSFHLAYVSEWRGTVVTMLLSKFHPDWEVVSQEDYTLQEDESEEDIFIRNQLSLKEANQSAIYHAYLEAKKRFQIKQKNFYVYYVEKPKETPLKVGDKIIKIKGETFDSIEVLREAISSLKVGDHISITIERNGKEKEVEIPVLLIDKEKMTGIAVKEIDDYETDPVINLHFKKIEGGPSGGLTTALAIYNRLTKEDITKGLKIVGTGTIEADGSVGEIGGVLYKLRGAVKNKADIFIVPSGDNYEDCLKEVKKKNYDIQLIAVDTFHDALEKLQN